MHEIIKDYIPEGRRNRPGHAMSPLWITVHDTGNPHAGADARAHAGYLKGNTAAGIPVSWHFTVDDSQTYQHLPLNESGWHAGDGRHGDGNRRSIGVEICMNSDGDRRAAEERAADLIAQLLATIGSLKSFPESIKQHRDWSGKNCPAVLRGRHGAWSGFLDAIKSNITFGEGSGDESDGTLYRVQVGAYSEYSNAKSMSDRLESDGFNTYLIEAQDGLFKVQTGAFSVRRNAEELSSRLRARGYPTYITTRGGFPASRPAEQPEPPPISEGDTVSVRRGATDYNGGGLASFVYDRTHSVMSRRGDRVVIGRGGVITAAVNVKDLTRDE